MTSLLILATVLIVAWLWSVWQRERGAAFMTEWNYVLLVGAVMCVIMAAGIWIRANV